MNRNNGENMIVVTRALAYGVCVKIIVVTCLWVCVCVCICVSACLSVVRCVCMCIYMCVHVCCVCAVCCYLGVVQFPSHKHHSLSRLVQYRQIVITLRVREG